MATAFLASTASLSVSARLKFRPGEMGHLLFFGKSLAPAPSKTHRLGFFIKSRGSQLMVNASNSQFLYFRVGNPGVSLAGFVVAKTRMTVMNEWENSGGFPRSSYAKGMMK